MPVESEGLVDRGGRTIKTMTEASPPNFTKKLLKLRKRKRDRFKDFTSQFQARSMSKDAAMTSLNTLTLAGRPRANDAEN